MDREPRGVHVRLGISRHGGAHARQDVPHPLHVGVLRRELRAPFRRHSVVARDGKARILSGRLRRLVHGGHVQQRHGEGRHVRVLHRLRPVDVPRHIPHNGTLRRE